MHLYLGLGANLGRRRHTIRRALEQLSLHMGAPLRLSPLYETEPVGMNSPHRFLNAAALFDTTLPAHEILRITQEVERRLGRTRKSRNGQHFDRTIDIDLLQYGNLRLDSPALTLPHPEMARRLFVMQPLADIAPTERHAAPPHLTFNTMYEQLRDYHIVCPTQADPAEWEAINVLIDQLSPGKTLSRADYQALLDNPSTRLALLCRQDGEQRAVVGMITLCLTQCPTGRKAWIEDVVVHSDYRRRGLSHRLLAWAKETAAREGQKKVMLTSRPARREANLLYQGEGFEQRQTNVYQLPL